MQQPAPPPHEALHFPDEIGVTVWIRGRPLRWILRGGLLAGVATLAAIVRVIILKQ